MALRSFTLKGIPEALYRRLRQRAAENRRSMNSEALATLERALQSKPVDPEDLLARIDALRDASGGPPLDDDDVRTAKSSGRP